MGISWAGQKVKLFPGSGVYVVRAVNAGKTKAFVALASDPNIIHSEPLEQLILYDEAEPQSLPLEEGLFAPVFRNPFTDHPPIIPTNHIKAGVPHDNEQD